MNLVDSSKNGYLYWCRQGKEKLLLKVVTNDQMTVGGEAGEAVNTVAEHQFEVSQARGERSVFKLENCAITL